MDAVANALESYRGRDRLVRTVCYSSRLLGGLLLAQEGGCPELGRRLLLIAQELSNCRATLRLFDDLSMFLYSRGYGLGGTEEDMIVRLLFITGNLVDQLYYPCEHLAWAADYKILSINAEKWWTLSNTLWTLSLALGALRSFRVVQLLKKKLKGSQNNVHLRMGEANCVSRQAYQTRMRAEILNIITCLADLTNAIHWMPPGFLWAGKFPEWLVGLMGTVSSVISLYQMSCGSCSTKDP
ncbi:peroxisomal membrane protein 11C isoform X1 [Rhincodon typus]|uniref:peroxisomal membrane protein 11C isoform X1 n=1 Tax=Rhincodon typus TaxID=259920 RepID=UPI0020301E21|nr:peroxisomal membrane protein 11C isoform X1 [Rhincodon typus]XP_048470071.1 peroxisomal membrane protein 11C isoform X1 [Rhincodon typus]